MAFLFVLSSNKVNIFYHILKLEKKYRFIPKGIFLLFFLLKWNCSNDIPECLLLEWFFFKSFKTTYTMYIIEQPQSFPAKASGSDSWGHNAVAADSVSVPFTTWKRLKSTMAQSSGGSTPQCLGGVGASVYSHSSAYTSRMLASSVLSYSDKHRRRKKEIWKFAVHLDTWCYSLFVSEKVNHFVML